MTHNFKKQFGQNFLSDKNLLCAICDDGEVGENDTVLEIGAGSGNLTKILSERAKRVVSYEIDKDLIDPLSSLGLKNVEFVFDDVMDHSLEEIEEALPEGYKMIANLPYYISSPIILKFLRSKKLSCLVIMLQKEVAQRLVATPNDKNYGVLSVMTNFFGTAKLCRQVDRKMFFPVPNVDSAVVKISLNKKYPLVDAEGFSAFICKAFSMRRKTLKNNFKNFLNENQIKKIEGKTLLKRAENLSLEEFIQIYLKVIQ